MQADRVHRHLLHHRERREAFGSTPEVEQLSQPDISRESGAVLDVPAGIPTSVRHDRHKMVRTHKLYENYHEKGQAELRSAWRGKPNHSSLIRTREPTEYPTKRPWTDLTTGLMNI